MSAWRFNPRNLFLSDLEVKNHAVNRDSPHHAVLLNINHGANFENPSRGSAKLRVTGRGKRKS